MLSGEASTTQEERASNRSAVDRGSSFGDRAQQAAWRQIRTLLVNAPARMRERCRGLPEAKLVVALTNSRADQVRDADEADTRHALRSLARRHRDLAQEVTGLEQRMLARATAAKSGLMAVKGVREVIGARLLTTAGDNPDRLRSSASFAGLWGTAPIPVSSGRVDRHRLCRGGDRQTNATLAPHRQEPDDQRPTHPRAPRRPPGQRRARLQRPKTVAPRQ